MKFSIIMPAYNGEKYIAETLDCLLSQSEKDIEIVVVNDGSTDSTQHIVETYAEKYPAVVLVNQENAGVSAARNNGIERARGEYIIFIDNDDLIGEGTLKNLYEAMKKTDADLAIYRVQNFGEDGSVQTNHLVDQLVKQPEIDCYDKRLLRNFIVSNKVYRAELLKKSGVRFPHMKYSEDGAFFMQFLHTVKPKITGVENALFLYRRHSGSVTHRVNAVLVSEFSKSMDYIYSIIDGSFEDRPEIKEEYLQEMLFKDFLALMNEFYRMMWKAEDDEALPLIGKRYEMLFAKMTDATKAKCALETKDLGKPIVFSRKEILAAPFMSIVVKNPTDRFMDELYKQSMPLFEVINRKEKPKGKLVLRFRGNESLPAGLLKAATMLRRSPKFGFFPDRLIQLGATLLLLLRNKLKK